MRTTFLPFSTPTIEEAEINEVVDSLKSGWITTGPKVKLFEEAFKAYVGAPYAVPLTSATAGLHLTLLALGIKEGDEIITTPMTFASTVSMIILCGGTPVLADIEPGTLNIDVTDPSIQRRIIEQDAGRIAAADPGFCDAVIAKGRINGCYDCGVIIPLVPNYPGQILEIVAAVHLKDALGLNDGDEVELELEG